LNGNIVVIEEGNHFFLLNLIRMALILSIPYWLPLSLETRSSKSYYSIFWL